MSKYVVFMFSTLAVSVLYGAPRYGIVSDIPSAASSTNVTLPAGGTNDRNCIEYVVVSSTSNYILRILNGNTTSYEVTKIGLCPMTNNFSGTPFCGSRNTAMSITVTPVADTGAAIQINYSGYIGR